jgi:hypothetical protein
MEWLVEAILQGLQSVKLSATRLTELDLPLDGTNRLGACLLTSPSPFHIHMTRKTESPFHD